MLNVFGELGFMLGWFWINIDFSDYEIDCVMEIRPIWSKYELYTMGAMEFYTYDVVCWVWE